MSGEEIKAKHCDECRHFDQPTALTRPPCAIGNKPRFYKPKHGRDDDWGWKRKCNDFEEVKK